MEAIKLIVEALGLIGIGGLLKSALDTIYAENKKRKDQGRHEFKEVRYKAILLLCHALINYDDRRQKLIIHRPEITSKEILKDELHAEWVNMALYASDKVILAMKKFLQNPEQDRFTELIFAMRKSLYDIKTSLNVNDLKLNL